MMQLLGENAKIIWHEIFSSIGLPARVAGRVPLLARYIWGGLAILSDPEMTAYAEERFGKLYKWRLGLLLDIKELKVLEDLINTGDDRTIAAFRKSQLSVSGMIAIIGALIAQMTITALQLPHLDQVHWTARASLIASLIMSVLSIFYACMQQRTFGLPGEPDAVRAWISTGSQHQDDKGNTYLRSSLASHLILSAPFEFVSIAVTLFLLGLGLYLGFAMAAHLELSPGPGADRAIFIVFLVVASFPCQVFGHGLGLKDREEVKSQEVGKVHPIDHKWYQRRYRVSEDPQMVFKTDVENVESHLGTDYEYPSRIRAEKDTSIGLTQALREAVIAHRQCAKANERVARYYDCLSDTHSAKRYIEDE